MSIYHNRNIAYSLITGTMTFDKYRRYCIYSKRFWDFCRFLLLARYVPNVAEEECMRSVGKKYEYWRPTTDLRFRALRHIAKISNDRNSATRQPIPFMFDSRVGFSVTADRTAPFPVGSNPRWRLETILKNSNDHISETHYPIHRPHFALRLYKWLLTHLIGDWTLIS